LADEAELDGSLREHRGCGQRADCAEGSPSRPRLDVHFDSPPSVAFARTANGVARAANLACQRPSASTILDNALKPAILRGTGCADRALMLTRWCLRFAIRANGRLSRALPAE